MPEKNIRGQSYDRLNYVSITKVLNEVHNFFLQKVRRNFESQKLMVNYSKRKSVKWRVYLLWGSFDHVNESIWMAGLNSSIAKVLTDNHAKFLTKMMLEFGSPKKIVNYSTWKLVKWVVNLLCAQFWPCKWVIFL